MSASTIARRAAVFGATVVLGLSLFGGAAFGAPTEDTDTNDGGTPNNVVDAGDNYHPSGKDRSVEHGGSGNQGKAASDPDDDGRGPDRTNGGADKPDGPGGHDPADQDGNNGCGNDDDFEDDNEGHCRKARSASAPASPKSPKSPEPKSPKAPKSPGSPNGGSPAPASSNPSSPGSPAGGAVLSTTDTVAVAGDTTLAPAASVTAGQRAEVLGVSLVAPATAAAAKPAVARTSVASRRSAGRPTEVLGVTYTRGAAGVSLARTGAASTLLVMGFGGVALLALGLGLSRWARPRRAAH